MQYQVDCILFNNRIIFQLYNVILLMNMSPICRMLCQNLIIYRRIGKECIPAIHSRAYGSFVQVVRLIPMALCYNELKIYDYETTRVCKRCLVYCASQPMLRTRDVKKIRPHGYPRVIPATGRIWGEDFTPRIMGMRI